MLRVSMVVCVWMILGITAKPWDKLKDEAFQETLVSLDGNEKLPWGVEVEPAENMDIIQYEIDPRMQISKSLTEKGQIKNSLLTEVDLNEWDQPSVAQILQAQIKNLNQFASVDTQEKSVQVKSNMQLAELDKDELNHPDVRVRPHEETEKDQEEAYRRAREQLEVYLAPLMTKGSNEFGDQFYQTQNDWPLSDQRRMQSHAIGGEDVVRLHLYPEEDMDDLYHKDLPDLNQDNSQVPSAVEVPSQRRYSQPEEDLDDLYHQ